MWFSPEFLAAAAASAEAPATLGEAAVALVTLVLLEVVLGIDNVIFIAILAGKLPKSQQDKGRKVGIALAVITRVALLFSLTWVMSLKDELFKLPLLNHGLSGRDLILLGGGLFLIGKSTMEIHEKLESPHEDEDDEEEGADGRKKRKKPSFTNVVIQIMILDIVFSLDSVITAVGIAGHLLWVMVTAIIIAAAVMLLAAGPISRFVEKHPTFKILALSFLILIGSILVIEGWDHDSASEMKLKNYVYFAMAFSVVLELMNMRLRKKQDPVHLHTPKLPESQSDK